MAWRCKRWSVTKAETLSFVVIVLDTQPLLEKGHEAEMSQATWCGCGACGRAPCGSVSRTASGHAESHNQPITARFSPVELRRCQRAPFAFMRWAWRPRKTGEILTAQITKLFFQVYKQLYQQWPKLTIPQLVPQSTCVTVLCPAFPGRFVPRLLADSGRLSPPLARPVVLNLSTAQTKPFDRVSNDRHQEGKTAVCYIT
ncbi:hypothetical protein BaRGS_00007148 [Batillaria attramentaria]|uniref:Uncharacterized protein n=1 Tax=Batillaria attramentaria TaxID=370345 RepID=A0ABD0LRQ8_9CAEN